MVQHLVEDTKSTLAIMPLNSNTKSNTYFGSGYYSVPSGLQSKHTILSGSYYFTPDEVEVFYLT